MYQLTIPTEPELLSKGVEILHQWATAITVSPGGLDAERSIVMEEWRQGRTSSGRAAEAYYKTLFEGSRYAERLPIGLEHIITGVEVDAVDNFYRKWYHPERIAVAVVGDFPEDNGAGMIALIQKVWAASPKVDAPAPMKPLPGLPQHDQLKVTITVDQEASHSSISLDCKRPKPQVVTESDFRVGLVEEMFHMCLNCRFNKISKGSDPPFLSAQSGRGVSNATTGTASISVGSHDGRLMEGLKAALTEVIRIQAHGLTLREVEMCKADILAELHMDYVEREQKESSSLIDDAVDHFISNRIGYSIETEVELSKKLLPWITRNDLKAAAACYQWPADCVVRISRPEGGSLVSQALTGLQNLTQGILQIASDAADELQVMRAPSSLASIPRLQTQQAASPDTQELPLCTPCDPGDTVGSAQHRAPRVLACSCLESYFTLVCRPLKLLTYIRRYR